ncbi:MAG TPA: hypothetical protein PLL33_05235 [Paracoccus sp. (in: a-proteobacteria)]|nr:hypothetical protein [Paracoccus sp. (in: a-proteobacteria)]
MAGKSVSAFDAAALVSSGDTVTTSGLVGAGVPDGLPKALGDRLAQEGQPRDWTGWRRSALRRIAGGHWGLIPQLGARALRGEIEGWNFPQEAISHL